MNISYRHCLLIFISCSLSACGQFGNLYLPGHGVGYYHNHAFTERPTTLTPPSTTIPQTAHPKSTAPTAATPPIPNDTNSVSS